MKWTTRNISPTKTRKVVSRGNLFCHIFAMLGTSNGQEKKTMQGQRYSICGKCMLATWFSLSPALGQRYKAVAAKYSPSTTPPFHATNPAKAPNIAKYGRRSLTNRNMRRGATEIRENTVSA